jgi:uncharacterized protein YndB with AHSA1/START domain
MTLPSRYGARVQDSVTVHINASPQQCWDIVTDITRIGEWSTEVFEQEWLDGATGPAVGARFRGHVKRNGRGPIYWSTCTITECVPGEVFTFTVGIGKNVVNTWSYRFVATDGGTDVTESYRLTPGLGTKVFVAIAGGRRNNTNVEGMKATLAGVKAAAEAP